MYMITLGVFWPGLSLLQWDSVAWGRKAIFLALVTTPAVILGGRAEAADSDASHYL